MSSTLLNNIQNYAEERRVRKEGSGTFKKGFNIVIDEVEPFDFFIEKK